MSRIWLKSGDVPNWFRVKVLAACGPVGGSVTRYWFDSGRFHAEIIAPALPRPLVARSVNGAERLEIVGRDADGAEFVAGLDSETQGDTDAGGDALDLLKPLLTEGAVWHA